MTAAATTLPYRPCAGVMLLNPAGLVFAGQRLDSPSPAWQMPQGGIDPGEEPLQAALRELYEETNVRSVELIAEGKFGHVAAIESGKVVAKPIEKAVKKLKLVDPGGELVRTARGIGIELGA